MSQPIEEWCEDNETLIINTADRAGHDISDLTMIDLVDVVRNTQSLIEAYRDDTFQGEL